MLISFKLTSNKGLMRCLFVETYEITAMIVFKKNWHLIIYVYQNISAVYIPPEKQRRNAMRKHWNVINNPGNILRMEMKKVIILLIMFKIYIIVYTVLVASLVLCIQKTS